MNLVLALLLAVLPLSAPQRAGVDALFNTYNASTPGCALGVYRDGAISYARGYGMADLERRVPITADSLFDVGSISKQFAAASIVLLAERKRLSLTDDVRTYIPELPNYGAPITLNELMWHTSGLRDYTDLLDLAGYGLAQVTTDEQALATIARQRALEFAPGTQYEYSNTNYFLLSVIVKRVTGQTLAQFAAANIFRPLGMTHTVYRDKYDMLIPNRAMGYAPLGDGHFRNSMSNWEQTGDGGVQLSVDDALKWDENFYHPRVGGRALIAQLQTPGHLSNGRRLQYARGLFIETYRGLPLITHDGAWIGYRGAFDRYPSVHTSVVVLCNSDAAQPGELARKVADIVLARHLAPLRKTARAAAKAVAPQLIAGQYFDAQNADVVRVAAGKSGAVIDAGGASYPLEPAGGTSFRIGSTTLRFIVPRGATHAASVSVQSADGSTRLAQRFAPAVPSLAQLRSEAGIYRSDELGVTWQLGVAGHTLALEPARNLPDGAAGKLEPLMEDTFSSAAGGFALRFVRDNVGRVTGFALGAGRGLRALRFTRVP